MVRDRGSSVIGQGRGNAVTVPDLHYLDRAGQQNEITQYDEDLIENAGARYTLAVIQAICIILAAIGNGFVIYIILKHKKLRRNATAFLILNLAICDFIGSVLQQPMRLVDLLLPFTNPKSEMNKWGANYCKITGFNTTLIACAGFLTVVAIAVERFLLIGYPLKAKQILTKWNVRISILVIWIVAIVTTLPLPIRFTFVAVAHFKEANISICMQDLFSAKAKGGSEYYMFIFVIYFVIPVVIISVCYTRVFYILYSDISSVEVQNETSKKVQRSRKRLAKMMLLIAVIFTGLHGPYFVTFLMVACGLGIPHNPLFTLIVLETLPLLNAVCNPFIYSAHSRSFFKKTMLSFVGGQYADSSVFRKDSATGSTRSHSHSNTHSNRYSKDQSLLEKDNASIRSKMTETTSLRTMDSFGPADISNRNSRSSSFQTHNDSTSLRSDSFRMFSDSGSIRRDEYLNTTKDSSFSMDERIPLSQIVEEREGEQHHGHSTAV